MRNEAIYINQNAIGNVFDNIIHETFKRSGEQSIVDYIIKFDRLNNKLVRSSNMCIGISPKKRYPIRGNASVSERKYISRDIRRYAMLYMIIEVVLLIQLHPLK